MKLSAPLVLASASPRRREILTTLGLVFEVVPSTVVEVREVGETPEGYARRLSRDKATEVAERLSTRDPRPWVIAADTIVVDRGLVLEKPADDADARAMIARLSAREHEVVTAVALARAGEGPRETIAVTTEVRFRALSDAEIARYVATGEGRDKAGGYAVQGIGAGLVVGVFGSYFNVVGLPAADTIALLERNGALREWP
jgi:septum formation protein